MAIFCRRRHGQADGALRFFQVSTCGGAGVLRNEINVAANAAEPEDRRGGTPDDFQTVVGAPERAEDRAEVALGIDVLHATEVEVRGLITNRDVAR